MFTEVVTAVLCSRKSLNTPHDQFLLAKLVLITASHVHRTFGSSVENHRTSIDRSLFVPIPELFRSDGNVQVIFLAGNGVSFYEQTDDAWYRGTAPGHEIINVAREGTHRVYWTEEAASPLACVEQFQLCNTALSPDKQCGPLASWNDALVESAPLFNMTGSHEFGSEYVPMDPTSSRFRWIIEQLNNAAAGLDTIIPTLGPQSLSSKANLAEGVMGRLPPNQWQLDVIHWWSTYLASIQGAFVETAIGPADPTGELEQYKEVPWNDHVRTLCNNQVCKRFQEPPRLFLQLICTSDVGFHPYLLSKPGLI